MKKTFLFILSVVLLVCFINASSLGQENIEQNLTWNDECPPKPNTLETLDQQPTLVASVENGQKFVIGEIEQTQGNYLYIAKLKGTSYEMGKAFGQLFKEQLKEQLDNFYNYYITMLQQAIDQKSLPKYVAKFIGKHVESSLNAILDLDILVTRKYTNKRYDQQIKGIADGAGFGYKAISRLNIFPQFIKAACTVAGIWGSASAFNHTLHMRALDWDKNNPISKFPVAVVYHPSEKGAIKHINVGYVGFVGVLTGISQKVSIGEKVWIPPHKAVKMTRFGTPWTYVLRDVLYEATDMKSAIRLLTAAHRTCAIHLGVASKDNQNFRMFQYSQNILNNYDDNNYTYTANHTKIKGVAFFDKHTQPSDSPCVNSLMKLPQYYQKWTMDTFWRVIGNSHKTGDTQLVVFDLDAQEFLISYSHTYENKTTEPAYSRRPILVGLKQLWQGF